MGCARAEVVGVDEPLFGIRAEEVFGMPDDELVEGRARSDEDADRPRPAAGAAELLPGRRDGAGIADQDRALQAADVDAELQRVRAHHPVDLSAAQAGLDLAPVQRQVTPARTPHAAGPAS